MFEDKRFYSYRDLGLRWGYASATAYRNALIIIKRLRERGMEINKTSFGVRKAMFSHTEVEKIEKFRNGSELSK